MASEGPPDASKTVVAASEPLRKGADRLYHEILAHNTTHFSPDELQRLFMAFKRVTNDRLQV